MRQTRYLPDLVRGEFAFTCLSSLSTCLRSPLQVDRTLTINWKTWEMTIDQKDNVDDTLSASRTIQIPPDWCVVCYFPSRPAAALSHSTRLLRTNTGCWP
jgi:hypothetical protein